MSPEFGARLASDAAESHGLMPAGGSAIRGRPRSQRNHAPAHRWSRCWAPQDRWSIKGGRRDRSPRFMDRSPSSVARL